MIQYVLPKKEAGPFWPRLLKQEKKVPWVKVDFEKWKDEDESDDEWKGGAGGAGGDFDMNAVTNAFGHIPNKDVVIDKLFLDDEEYGWRISRRPRKPRRLRKLKFDRHYKLSLDDLILLILGQ